MPHPSARQTLARAFAFVALFAALAGTLEAAARPTRYKPLSERPDDPGLALLVFVVDAPYAIRSVVLADEQDKAVASLEIGSVAGEYSARTFALPLGRYHISAIVAPDFQRKPFEILDAPRFTLTSGQLNYIGDFEVYLERDDLMCRLHNGSGRLVIHLRDRAPSLIDGLQLAYVGGDDDGWVGTLGASGR